MMLLFRESFGTPYMYVWLPSLVDTKSIRFTPIFRKLNRNDITL
jgi:hypothetical protein